MDLTAIDGQFQQQPRSIPDDDDFEVIDSGQSISPYEMSLLPTPPSPQQPTPGARENPPLPLPLPSVPEGQTEPPPTQLLTQLAEAKRRFASLQSGLAGNNHILQGLAAKLQQAESSTSPTARAAASCQDCQALRQELARLSNCQEECQQTAADYAKLKSQFGSLANAKELLEAERDELAQRLQQQQQRPAESAAGNSESKAAVDQMRQRVCELEALVQETTAKSSDLSAKNQKLTNELRTGEENNRQANQKVEQLTQKVAELRGELEFEQAKLCEAEIRYNDSLSDLRRNSHVRQLEQLRQELQLRDRRDQEREKLYGESDQAVDDILREAENAKGAAYAEISELKQKLQDMETSLVENSRRMEAVTEREIEQRERADKLEKLLAYRADEHRREIRKLQEELSCLHLLHRQELESERQSSRFRAVKITELEYSLQTLSTETEELRQSEAKLQKQCNENDRTINEILSSTDAEKQKMQRQLNDLMASLASADEQLRRRTEDLMIATKSIENLQRHSDNLQGRRLALEQQLADCQLKCSEATDMAQKFRTEREELASRVRDLESSLSGLQLEHTKVRTGYNQLEHSLAECMARTHRSQEQASQAEATMEEYRRAMGNCQRAFDQEVQEKEALRKERDQLREQANRVRSAIGN